MTANEPTESRSQRRPLDGLRVLDVTGLLSGPYATMLLGDLGAEVIKVEHPDRPDETRQSPPFFGGESHYFIAINRNKRSVAADLKSEAGRRLVLDLAAGCDVLLENFRPGVTSRLGISFDDVRAVNPDVVYCSISGFGQEGPDAQLPAYDLITLAASGVMSTTGEPGRPPVKLGLPLSDLMSGAYAALLCLAGLRRRQATGAGGYFDVSMLECTLAASTTVLADLHLNEPTGSPPANYFPEVEGFAIHAADDGHVVVHPPAGAPVPGPRAPHAGSATPDGTRALVAAAFVDQGIPAAPILSVGEALDAELTRRRSMVVTMDHPTAGRIETVGTAFKMTHGDGTSFAARYAPPPLLGQDTDLARAQGWTQQPAQAGPQVPPAADAGDAARPLQGLRVLELGTAPSAAVAALLLADLGADVVKVHHVADVAHDAAVQRSLQRGKRSVLADVAGEEGGAVVTDLARRADVILTGGASDVPVLDGATLARLEPGLIVASCSGFGLTDGAGPSTELVHQAGTGLLHLTGEPDRAPTPVGLPVATQSAAILTCIGLLSALHLRDHTGLGTHLDLSTHDAIIGMLGYLGQLRLMTGDDPQRVGSRHHHIIPYGVYGTADGAYVAVAAFTQQMFEKFMRAVGRPDVAEDPRFASSAQRKENRDLLEPIVEGYFSQRTASDVVAALQAANVPCSKIMSVVEALSSETIAASQIIGEWSDGSTHRRFLGSPFRMNGRPLRTQLPPSRPGQHTDEVLREHLGYDDGRIAHLREEGAVR